MYIPGPPKEPKIIAQYPKKESIGSIVSIVLAILEVQAYIYIYIHMHIYIYIYIVYPYNIWMVVRSAFWPPLPPQKNRVQGGQAAVAQPHIYIYIYT